jgi:hypothetical protein
MPRSSPPLPPLVLAWFWMILVWPLGDLLRKFAGLNEPIYILHLLMPALVAGYLWQKKALRLHSSIVAPSLTLAALTGALALYYAITTYTLFYLGVWLLCLSALIGPPFLLCAALPIRENTRVVPREAGNRLIALVATLLIANSILAVAQSVLGRSHFLSVGAGGALDSQIGTNTAIELRAPGLFTFVVGSASFSVIAFIFLMGSLGFAVSKRTELLRLLALLLLPIAVVRTISRLFVINLLFGGLPYISLLKRARFILSALVLFLVATLLLVFVPTLQDLVTEGYVNFVTRFTDADGLIDGIILRFFTQLYSDPTESGSLITSFSSWFVNDPLAALFGYGLGFSSPLFRFVQGSSDTAYGFIIVDGKSFLLGETAFSSLFADLGLFGLLSYLALLIQTSFLFLRKFPPLPLTVARAPNLSFFLIFLISLNSVYFRPSSVFYTSLIVLTPAVRTLLSSSAGPATLSRR